MPKFSVIVPAFNVEQYIDRCVTSVLNQTYSDFELIIIDDGSTDGSGKMLDDYSHFDSRIKVIHTQNQGQSAARNVGLEQCTGEYVYFCDADDWIEPFLLEKCLEKIESEQADIVRFQCFTHINGIIKDSGLDLARKSIHFETSDEKLSFLCRDVLKYKIGWELWSGIWRASIIKKHEIRFPKGINIAEDLYFFILNVFFGNNCSFIDEPMYHYCLRDDSTMGQAKGKLRINDTNELALKLYEYLLESDIKEKFYYIHNAMILNELNVVLPLLSKRGTSNIFIHYLTEINNYKFFIEQTKNARKKLRHYYRKEFGFYIGMKRNNLNRFIIDHNYYLYLFSSMTLEIANVLVRIIKKTVRKIKQKN